ncbi:chromate transporter [Paenibacillus albidus]|uniref:Chromate transporter n=1 Tax=Paenibacillus albidus TaxID=2041023 RepID=A0A917FS23_9BACL|nr:chromate transporter [Paenibacillus albidus]GGG00797.1 chromate transporter [Paenibacillus albidus]
MNTKLKEQIKMLPQIFGVFFRIGPSTFGGGYAMIATIEQEIVHRKGWMEESEMGDMVSISGSAPGGVAVNSAAFIGYRLGGVPGAVAAVTGITLPTFVIVFVLSLFYALFKDNDKVEAALKGIHAAVVALIIMAAFKMGKSSILDVPTLFILATALSLLLFTGIPPFYLILGGPLVGIAVVIMKRMMGLSIRTEAPSAASKQELNFPEYYI